MEVTPEELQELQAQSQKENEGAIETQKPDVEGLSDNDGAVDEEQQQQQTQKEGEDSSSADQLQQQIQDNAEAAKELQQDLESKGLDFAALENEYLEKGELSAESLAALEKAGYPQQAVKTYIAGLEAVNNKFADTVYGYAGGKEAFTSLQQFVQSQGEEAVQAFNSTLENGNLSQISLLIAGVKAQMQLNKGSKNPRMILGDTVTGTGNLRGFATQAEMTKAMQDPRYNADPVYTQEVVNKVLNTNFIK